MMDFSYERRVVGGLGSLKKVNKSTLLILEEAEKLGVSWEILPLTDLIKLEYKGKTQYFHARVPAKTSALAMYCCGDKRIARNILKSSGLAVSDGLLIQFNDNNEYREQVFQELEKPLVVKPLDASLGNNVHLNIRTKKDFFDAIDSIYQYYGEKEVDVLVEEMFEGIEYRILATKEKILSVIKRIPANVIGDGKSDIRQLIEVKNQDPLRQKIDTYEPIEIGNELIEYLRQQGLTLDSVLEEGRRVFLLAHSPFDIGSGGDTIDVTEEIHPSVAENVSKIFDSVPGLLLTGIDYMAQDISKTQTLDNYRIIEINSSPFLDWNEFPLKGPHRKIAYEFLKIMFPNLD